jgi:predicted negative regulator of RcsB-dependent stress response
MSKCTIRSLAVQIADEALLQGALDHPSWAGLAHRLKGEAYERLNDPEAAIVAYERALSVDPKAGVRWRLERLRKS